MKPIIKSALEATWVAATTVVCMRLVSSNSSIDTWKPILVFVPTFLITFVLAALLFKQRSER